MKEKTYKEELFELFEILGSDVVHNRYQNAWSNALDNSYKEYLEEEAITNKIDDLLTEIGEEKLIDWLFKNRSKEVLIKFQPKIEGLVNQIKAGEIISD